MKYFVNFPYTAETLKREYRELCKKLHPDTGGNEAEFKAMAAEYEQIARNLEGNGTTNKTRTAATDDTTAQDFADLMGAPLKGTKGKTFADLVAELADIMADENRRRMYESEGETWGCYGWDGCAMTPESRAAYVKKFGRTIIEMAELCAQMKQAADAKAYEQTHHAAHVREARKNQSEGNRAPKAGAFVFGVSSGMKCDGGHGIFEEFSVFAARPDYITEHEDDERRNLCKVMEVIEVSAEDFARPELADELVKKAHDEGREFAGGSATDDPEPADDPRDPYAKYKYYYTKVAAVVCRETGRWFLIDCEGYSYARYTYMPKNFRTMYAQEIREAQDRHAAQVEAERQEEECKAAERLAEYRAKCAKYEAAGLEDLTPYKEAVNAAREKEHAAYIANHYRRNDETRAAAKETQKANAALMAAEKRNILKMAAHIYPGIRAKVTKAEAWKSGGFTLTYTDGPTLKEFQDNTDFDLFAAYWEEYRMDDCTETHRYDLTEFADKYGDGHGVNIEREASDETRAALNEAILKAVPEADGIGWRNRHPWTAEELTAAAAACGVDAFTLRDEYERKHTYFNYVDAPTLAEWAFNLLTYDIEAPKGKKTTRKDEKPTEKPQDEPTAAEPTNDTPTASEAVSEAEKPATDSETPATTWAEAPAEGLELIETAEGVAVTGSPRCTYKHRKEIKAHGCHWNKQAQRWEATDPADVEKVRAWFYFNRNQQADTFFDEQSGKAEREQADEITATAEPLQDSGEIKADTATASAQAEGEAVSVSPLLEALADMLRTFADIMQQAKRWEGVTVPAATLERWKQEATDGTTTAAARLAEVCACLGSLTPDSRRDFDALGTIFWSLSEQIRNGCNPDTLQAATDYARAQLFDLIDRTQNPNQARAVREANDTFREAA